MSDREYTPNSDKYRAEQKAAAERKIEKVVSSGAAKTKKKGEVSRFAGKIFSGEDKDEIKSHLVDDVFIPGIKNIILDLIIDGATRLIGGGRRRSSSSSSGGSRVSYRDFYNTRDDRPVGGSGSGRRFDFDEILFPTRGDAEAVLDQMYDVIERYSFVTVADMYEMANLQQPYTSNKYGWTNLRDVHIVGVRDGYVIKLPKVGPID